MLWGVVTKRISVNLISVCKLWKRYIFGCTEAHFDHKNKIGKEEKLEMLEKKYML